MKALTLTDAVVLPEVRNSIVISSAKRDVSAKARQILATGDSWTDRYVAGTGTVFSTEVAGGSALYAIEHFAADVDGTTEN